MPSLDDTSALLQRPMVAQAVKTLLRRIHAQGLRPGDKLPPQSQLRTTDGRGASTLDAAMAILVERGVLSRRRRVGTVVEAPDAAIPGLWSVGFAYAPEDLGPIPFSTLLSALVQSQLVQRGFVLQVFPRTQHQIHQRDRLASFDRLESAVAERAIDGLATTADLADDAMRSCQDAGIPLVHIGHCYGMPCASLFDRRQWMEQALDGLRARQARRIHLVANFPPSGVDLNPWWTDFTARAAGDAGQAVLHARGNGHEAGMVIADDLLALSAEQRPDGLIISDDRIASGLTLRLAVSGAYRPRVAVQTCRQVPQPYGWPVMAFCSDLHSLVGVGLDLLTARIRIPELPAEQRIQTLERVEGNGSSITGDLPGAT